MANAQSNSQDRLATSATAAPSAAGTGSTSPERLPAERGYWRQARTPLASLFFVLPLLAAYEGGVLWLGAQAVRNGADVWLRRFLEQIGLGQYLLLPLLTIGALLGWHFTTRRPWTFSLPVQIGMWLESAAWSAALWQLARLRHHLWPAAIDTASTGNSPWPAAIAFLGAGIYEELLFRLMLLPILAGLFTWCKMPPRRSLSLAMLLQCLVFAAAHHLPGGEAFRWDPFLFRIGAGMFFSMLFLWRGFGIAVGAHAGYDVLVGLLLKR